MGKDYVENCCRHVMTSWLDEGAQGYPVSWKGFIKALEDIQLRRVLLDIEEAINCTVQ